MTKLFRRAIDVVVDTIRIASGGLDVAFQIEKDLSRHPNKAEIKIRNLNENHRRQLEQLREVRVALKAGFEDGVATLFYGDLRRASTVRDGDNLVTTVSGGDGDKASRARASQTRRRGEGIVAALGDIVDSMGVAPGNLFDAFAGAPEAGRDYRGAVTVDGDASRDLTELLDSAGLEWSVQDGTLQVLRIDQALGGTAVRLSADTGLLGSPSVDAHGIVTAETMLIPDVFPGRRVVFESESLRGLYRVRKATYAGDTASDAWGIHLECKKEAA